MEVIKHGNTFNKITCPVCKCKLNIHREDYQFYTRPEDKEVIPYVECPECWESIIFRYNKRKQKLEVKKQV